LQLLDLVLFGMLKIKMKNLKKLLIIFFTIIFASQALSKDVPASFADLAEKLMPSVVNISTTQTVVTKSNPFPGFEFPPGSPFEDMFKEFGTPQTRKASALGSGFIIDSKGIVITNNHVIQGAEDILVRVDGDREYKAKILGKDPLSDIAVLKIDSKENFVPVKFGDSDKSRIGDWVIAIGNPFGLGGTVTAGIISARNRSIGLSRYEDYIQTDASINQGNSGGPLFDMNGDVIGINTAILGQSGSIGIGFSIPSNSAKKVINQLIEYGETKRGWLGVRIQIVTKEIAEAEKLNEPRGALVASVADNSPSDKAGIKAGDIILEFNGTKIKEMKELPKIVAQTEVGKIVTVKVWRNKKEIKKNIKLGRLETSQDFKQAEKKETKPEVYEIKSLKIIVRLLNARDIEERKLPNQTTGLVIVNIDKDSPINNLKVNNIIIEAQKKKIRSSNTLEKIIKEALKSKEKTILIAIYNNQNQRRYIGVKLD
jgi:serine protease Do